MQNYAWFTEYFPAAYYATREEIYKILASNCNVSGLVVELGTANCDNLRQLRRLGFNGKMRAYDLAIRYPRTKWPGIDFIVGNVIDTLDAGQLSDIEVLFLDLDQNPEVTFESLLRLTPLIQNSWIYIDEFLGSGADSLKYSDCNTFARWLVATQQMFELVAYTTNGALIKMGQGNPSERLFEIIDRS